MIRKPRMKWLLVEWERRSGIFPEYDLVHVRSLVDAKTELHTGKTVCVDNGNNENLRAKVVMVSDDKRFLDQQLILIKEHSQHIEQAAAACKDAFNTSYQYNGDSTHNQIKTLAKDWSSDEEDEIGSEIRETYESKRKMQQSHFPNRKKICSIIRFESDSYTAERDPNLQSSLSKMTYDQGTQTIEQHQHHDELMMSPDNDQKIKVIENALEEMEERMSFLHAIIQKWTNQPPSPPINVPIEFNNDDTHYPDVNDTLGSINQSQGLNSTTDSRKKRMLKVDNYHSDASPDDDNNVVDDLDMVPIGSGKTLIPKHILTQIDWNSYTMATRKLLMAVFPRRTLATHSLTGKSSPAFMNKPAKLCLDPVKINDIVDAVKLNCNVKENLVRNAITTKCADENKMYRMRLEKIGKRQKPSEDNPNQENIPPAPDTSCQQQTTNNK